MAPLKQKGDRAEIEVAHDLVRRGYRIAIPYGEDWDFDLIFQRPGSQALERVQVKHASSDGAIIPVRCCSQSLTNGRVRQTKMYTARTIDWLAVFDAPTDRCFYIPASELGTGRKMIHLRVAPTRNSQEIGIRHAADYEHPEPAAQQNIKYMEPAGLEPAASRMQTGRSPN